MFNQNNLVANTRQASGRYKINFIAANGREEQILVLCDPESNISNLRDEIGRRLNRAGIPVATTRLWLRLDSRTGPLLSEDDPVGLVLPGQITELVFASEMSLPELAVVAPESSIDEAASPPSDPEIRDPLRNKRDADAGTDGSDVSIKVRVLTPHLARRHKDTKDVAVMPAVFSSKTTLRQLYERTSQHLNMAVGVEANGDKQAHQDECNCSLARAIHQETLFRTPSETPTANRVLIIHSRNVIEPLECAAVEEAAIIRAVRERYSASSGFPLEDKRVRLFGANSPEDEDSDLDDSDETNWQDDAPISRSSNSPVIVTICSAKRHQRYDITATDNSDELAPIRPFALDLHTAECPVKTQDLSLTLGELCLPELAIDGVLTIYAVPRRASLASSKALAGKDNIYLTGTHWELSTAQTERGMAMFLSTLRMAVHLIQSYEKGGRAGEYHDGALHILHVLTRFPPAVRALHILVEGSVLAEQECAALVQACYEVMVDMMAASVLSRSRERTLEGSRLLFSTLLSKAEEFATRDNDGGPMLPYICSMKSVSLTNNETMEPIVFPVDTSVGMMEQGCFDALKAGIIQFTDDELNQSLKETVLDGRTTRAVLLAGGSLSTNTMFDMDISYSSGRYRDMSDESKVLPMSELTNILQHAANAFSAKLQVVAPESLSTAPNPVLTLDRDGLLAVYLGRKACGRPGQDFTIFRPTKGGECEIDISIVAQLLEPIIAARIADGTAIFDGEFYAAQRRSDKPDEILMICVDCSSSMSQSAGFVDTKPSHDDDDGDADRGRSETEDLLDEIRQNEIYVGTLDDMKEALQFHESFDDIIHTVKATPHRLQQSIAAQLLKQVIGLLATELVQKMETLEGVRRSVWRDRTGETRQLENVVKGLRGLIAGLIAHEPALSEFLVYRGCGIIGPGQPNDWKWNEGDAIPTLHPNGSESSRFASTPLNLTVPHELRCPMTQELFRDPARTQDGHTYESTAIQKWLRIAETSPMTGLRLPSTQLNSNRPMLLRANRWAEGTETIQTTLSTVSLTQRGATLIRVNFVSPFAQFTRTVPLSTLKSTLYELAFRGLRGQYPAFSLGHNGTVIQPTIDPLSTLNPSDGFRVTVHLPDTADSQTAIRDGSNLCLVKVYRQYHTSAAFSYWVRTDTKASVGSVLFKTWRHIRQDFPSYPTDCGMEGQSVWHSLKHIGDGNMSGTQTRHWDRLSGLLKTQYTMGILGPEPLYTKPTNNNTQGGSRENGEGDTLADTQPTKPMVLKVYIGGASRKRKDGAHSSRLSVLKQMFDQFVNRILAYGYSTHLGLIQFDNTAKVAQRLSPVIENFRSTVQELQHQGDTALWDALALARDQIQEYSAAYPDAKKRILCISDGVDTSSKMNTGSNLWQLLASDSIVVDSFCLGSDDNSTLRAVSHLTNGYKFHPKSLEQAMAICEMEPVLSQLERDMADIGASRQQHGSHWHSPSIGRFETATWAAIPEIVTQDIFPKRIQHPNLLDDFVELKGISRRVFAETRNAAANDNRSSDTSPKAAATYFRTQRLLNEIQQIVADPHPHADVYVSERDMSFWKIIMQGPPGSVYEGGTFAVYLHMEEDSYPSFAPKARFVTPIYHPNVNRHGRICHSILDRNWTVDMSNKMLIATVYGLLMEPDYGDPVNIVVTLDFHHDQVAFAEMAREFIQRHATKTRADWRAEILAGQEGH